MAANLNNQFWKLRTKHGRDKLFESEDILWSACAEYFEETDKRTWEKIEFHGKDADRCVIDLVVPYTWTGLFLFLNISHQTWKDYETREGFIEITTRVRNIIYTQKFEGASVGAFNPVLISRDLGLVDKKEVNDITPKKITIKVKRNEDSENK